MPRILSTILAGTALAVLVTAAPPALAAKPAVYTPAFSQVAVGGFDPVAYFTLGRPVQGTSQFKTEYRGAEFRFASAANLAAFRADPARYAPQYGGYCAWAAAQGYTAPGRPQHWRVVNGKLYLNYNAQVQSDWEKNIAGFIRQADANWPGLLAK
jgi:YHS domain-containing protein